MEATKNNYTTKTVNENDTNESYNPFAHRTNKHFISNFGSWTNLIKSAAGTGLFAMPNAFACVGLTFGIIGTILMGLLITVSLQFLIKTHYKMCVQQKKPTLTYDEVVAVTLTTGALKGRISSETAMCIVDVTMLSGYIGIGAVYIVFVSGIIQECFDPNRTIGQSYYALMLFPLFLLMNMIKNLKVIAPISVFGNLFFIIAAIIGVVYALKDGLGDSWVMMNPMTKMYPKFLGTVFFSMCSPGLILEIEHCMQKPWDYGKKCGVLNWGMIVLVIMHVFVGAIGYLKWGDASLGNFIRNHVENDIATLTALIMQCLAIYFTYGLQCYMPISILYKEYAIPAIEDGTCRGTPALWNIIIRFGLTLITCVLAVAVPKLDLFTGLVGAVCIATLGTLIPVILYIIVNYGDYGRLRWKLLVSLIMLLVGLLAMLCATVTSLLLIADYFQHGTQLTPTEDHTNKS